MTKKRLRIDAIVEGDVEIQDLDGLVPLYLKPTNVQLLHHLLIKCQDCDKLIEEEKQAATYIKLQLESLIQRQV